MSQILLPILETIYIFSFWRWLLLHSRLKLCGWRYFILRKLYYFHILCWSLFLFLKDDVWGPRHICWLGLFLSTFGALYTLGNSTKFGVSIGIWCSCLGPLRALWCGQFMPKNLRVIPLWMRWEFWLEFVYVSCYLSLVDLLGWDPSLNSVSISEFILLVAVCSLLFCAYSCLFFSQFVHHPIFHLPLNWLLE